MKGISLSIGKKVIQNDSEWKAILKHKVSFSLSPVRMPFTWAHCKGVMTFLRLVISYCVQVCQIGYGNPVDMAYH